MFAAVGKCNIDVLLSVIICQCQAKFSTYLEEEKVKKYELLRYRKEKQFAMRPLRQRHA